MTESLDSHPKQKLECSFGYLEMPFKAQINPSLKQSLQKKTKTNSKLSEMLSKCAENNTPSSWSSITPLEELPVPHPAPLPRPHRRPETKSYSTIQSFSYKNAWSSYGSSFKEFPAHIFRPPSNKGKMNK